MKKNKNNKGFSLVELVIVVAILAILVGILAPQYTKYVEKSRKAADVSNLEELVKGFQVLCADTEKEINPGTYYIGITDTGAEVRPSKSNAAGSTANTAEQLTTYLEEFLSKNWTTYKLKSSKWYENKDGSGKKLTQIYADCVVGTDGSVTVTYNPSWVKEEAKASDNKTGN